MSQFTRPGTHGLLLEAEVAGGSQERFENRYLKATGVNISPGDPVHYQHQPNKWGQELRVYFNDPGMADCLTASGIRVEHGRSGYLSGEYEYRVNNNSFWWKLVEDHGLRLGLN